MVARLARHVRYLRGRHVGRVGEDDGELAAIGLRERVKEVALIGLAEVVGPRGGERLCGDVNAHDRPADPTLQGATQGAAAAAQIQDQTALESGRLLDQELRALPGD